MLSFYFEHLHKQIKVCRITLDGGYLFCLEVKLVGFLSLTDKQKSKQCLKLSER